ncbi:MAG TPA: diguanylate cyclase [Capsulimonadaceae bacterium]|jgi:diguanylate cyclase (GGDEF)-like protein/PAS domain S-box-containing protein
MASLAQNETERLATLRSCNILDTNREEVFDDITQMAAALCGTPIAAITLIDHGRFWFKSTVGIEVQETTRDIPFCAHTILSEDILVVPDASLDPRFAESDLVSGKQHIRFYAGAPLVTSDRQALGTLCVVDVVPRKITPDQERALRTLARHATAMIELRRSMNAEKRLVDERAKIERVLEGTEGKFRAAIDSMQEGFTIVNSSGAIILCNPQAAAILGLSEAEITGRTTRDHRWQPVTEHFEELPPDRHPSMLTLADGQPCNGFVVGMNHPSGELRWISVNTSLVQQPSTAPEDRLVVCTFSDITDRKREEFDLARLAAVIESSKDAIVTTTVDGMITSWNAGAEALLGYTADEMIGTQMSNLSPDDEHRSFIRGVRISLAKGGSEPPFVSQRRAKDGTLIDVSVQMSPVRDSLGRIIGISGVVRDIREQKALMESLRKSEDMLSEAQMLAGLGCWDYNVATKTLIWSDQMYTIVGGDSASQIPSPESFFAMIHPDDQALVRRQWKHAVESGTGYDSERRVILADGTVIWVHVRTKVDRDDGVVSRIYGTMLDITERKRNEHEIADYTVALRYQMGALEVVNKKLAELSVTDGLTGLSNHRALQERLLSEFHRAQRHKTPLSVVMIDVDRFKDYNDGFGHPAGDEVLKDVAAIIHSCTRETDMAARYGGEEFVLVLPHTDEEGAYALAERIRHKVEQHTWKRRTVTISVGCASLDEYTAEYSTLIAEADAAMYTSKQSGRNCVSVAAKAAA